MVMQHYRNSFRFYGYWVFLLNEIRLRLLGQLYGNCLAAFVHAFCWQALCNLMMLSPANLLLLQLITE